MKVFIFIAIVVIAATGIVASPVSSSGNSGGSSSSSNNKKEVESDAQTQAQAQAQAQSTAEINRSRKSAYGGGYAPSIPAPPCAKNYMFSCQPSMAPAPCAPQATSYGSQASYSAPVPTYTMPVHGNQGSVVPQMYAASGYLAPQGLNNYPSANQYYQY